MFLNLNAMTLRDGPANLPVRLIYSRSEFHVQHEEKGQGELPSRFRLLFLSLIIEQLISLKMSSKKKMRSNSTQSFHKNVNRVTPLSAIYTRRKCPPKKPKLGSTVLILAKRQYEKDVRYERLAYI